MIYSVEQHMPSKAKKTPARHRRPRARRQVVIRATLRDIEPAIWRLVRVPDNYTLHQLHRVLQLSFGWLDYHLYEFQVGMRSFEAPDPEAEREDSTGVTLADLELEEGSRLLYVYDFGDNWHHDVEVTGFLPISAEGEYDWSPRLIDGARAGPPEDSRGASGYADLIEALDDPHHPDHARLRDWVGPVYDPELCDVWMLDRAITLASAWGAI